MAKWPNIVNFIWFTPKFTLIMLNLFTLITVEVLTKIFDFLQSYFMFQNVLSLEM